MYMYMHIFYYLSIYLSDTSLSVSHKHVINVTNKIVFCIVLCYIVLY